MLILVTKVQTIQCNLQYVERHQDNRIGILLSSQFCCESKTALKNSLKKKIIGVNLQLYFYSMCLKIGSPKKKQNEYAFFLER